MQRIKAKKHLGFLRQVWVNIGLIWPCLEQGVELETLRHPYSPAGFCKSLTPCLFCALVSSAALWLSHAPCAVSSLPPTTLEALIDHCDLLLVKP